MRWDSVEFISDSALATRIAEWGWGGVGHALGFNYIALRLGPGYKDRPSGRAAWGRVGPSRAG